MYITPTPLANTRTTNPNTPHGGDAAQKEGGVLDELAHLGEEVVHVVRQHKLDCREYTASTAPTPAAGFKQQQHRNHGVGEADCRHDLLAGVVGVVGVGFAAGGAHLSGET